MSYKAWNAAMPTTAAMVGVATANGVKTMLQIAAPSTRDLEIISWGYSLSVTPPGISSVELIQTDVAATVTAHVASGIISRDPNATASLVTLGASATGFTATGEGSTTATRLFDMDQLGIAAGNNPLNPDTQFMPDEERWIVARSKFLRIRTTFTSTTPLLLCWVAWRELG
jgi:hypothetical protein